MFEIAAFILPSKRIKERILNLKKNVKKKFGDQPYLSHPPHCTLFTLTVAKEILKKNELQKNLLFKSNSNNRLEILKAGIFKLDPITKGKTIYYEIKKNSFLKKLQTDLLKKTLKFIKKNKKKKFKYNWMTRNYTKYGYPFVGQKWKPHFTIASLVNVNDKEKFIKNFLNSKIKFYQPLKKIHFYKINGNKHIYLWSISIKLKK